ncbi:MAG: tetratricopeptide repeat protein [Anaerolineales bacterium]
MTGRPDLFEESMQLGHSAAWDQDWERAIEFYRKALAESPENADALTSLGLALLETGHEKEALSVYHQASKVTPDDPIPIEKCAEIFEQLDQKADAIQQREAAADRYMKRRDAEKAVENWTHIGRLAPSNLKARSRLALTNERLGRRREAVHEYLAVAAILQSNKRTQQAAEALQRALGLTPGDAEATEAMRTLRQGNPLPAPRPPIGATKPLRMSQVKAILEAPPEDDFLGGEEAELDLEAPADVEIDDPEVAARQAALSILAGLLFEEPDGSDNGASPGMDFNSLTKGITPSSSDSVGQPPMYRYLSQAIDLQMRDHKRQSVKEYQRAIDAGLSHPAAHYSLGFLLKELGEYDEAQKHLMEAVGHPELQLGANLALGRLNRLQGDMGEAARFLVQALRIADGLSVDESKSSELSQLYDSILASQDEGDEESLTQIVENTLNFLSGPEWLERIRNARQQLRGEAEVGASVVPIARMIAVGGGDRVLDSLKRIDQFVQRGMLSTAMEESMLALQSAPSYLALHRRMAEIQLRAGDIDAGTNKLGVVAETHRVRGETREATDVYLRLLQFQPVNLKARKKLILLLEAQGRYEEALDHYMEQADLFRQMAQVEKARKSLAEGYEHAQRNNAPKSTQLRLLKRLGDIDVARLDWRRALEVFQDIRQLDPNNPEARTKLIDLNLRLGEEDEAAEILDTHLEQLVQSGNRAAALELLEDLAREHPGKQSLHSRLADAYRAAGRQADAIAQYDALGELQLDIGDRAAAIQTIQTIIDMEPPDIDGYHELLRNLQEPE